MKKNNYQVSQIQLLSFMLIAYAFSYDMGLSVSR